MIKKTLTLLLIFFVTFCYSQNTVIKGYIIDAKTNDSIPYVNIGVLKKGIGTVSEFNGSFTLDTKHAIDNDTIKFSSLGYKPRIFTKKSLKEILQTNPNIKLEESVEALDEVLVISKKKWKKKTLGSETESTSMTMGFSPSLGSELGRRINVSKKHTHLLKFKAYVPLNTFKTIKLRLNFYEANNDLPGKKINTENIYVEFKDEKGALIVDLEKYSLMVNDDFFVTLEWVDNDGDGEFRISSRVGTSGIKQKVTSGDDWRNLPFTLGYNILVKY